MLFSIIIPTYNRADFIGKTINSVLNQTYKNFEIIVIDDGSTDNTREVVNNIKDERIHYYKKENEERAAARNFGVKKAKGEYVTFLDSDDLFYENHLEEANIFLSNNKPEFMFQAYDIVHLDYKEPKRFKNHDLNQLLVSDGNVMSCHGVFIENEIAKNNLFNEDRDLSASEDYELWLRLASKYKIHHNPIVTSCLIDHDSRSVVNIDKDKLILRKELFLKYTLENPDVNAFIGKKRKQFIANTYSYIALHLMLAGYKKDAIKYLIKSILKSPRIIIKKRFFVIVKRVLVIKNLRV